MNDSTRSHPQGVFPRCRQWSIKTRLEAVNVRNSVSYKHLKSLKFQLNLRGALYAIYSRREEMEAELINRRFEENRKRQGLTLKTLEEELANAQVTTLEEEMQDVDEYQRHPNNPELKLNSKQFDYTDEASSTTFRRTKIEATAAAQDQPEPPQGDKSRKGSVDERILPLVTLINSTDDFFTTSTCSGRIILFATETKDEADLPSSSSSKSKIKKRGCKWLLVSHDEISTDSLVQAWDKACEEITSDISFKVEPAILHIQCRKLSDAKRLVHIATESGFRNSGMVIGKENRITVAVRSAMSLEVPMRPSVFSHSLFTKNFITFLVEKANEKMLENWGRMNSFMEQFKGGFANI